MLLRMKSMFPFCCPEDIPVSENGLISDCSEALIVEIPSLDAKENITISTITNLETDFFFFFVA